MPFNFIHAFFNDIFSQQTLASSPFFTLFSIFLKMVWIAKTSSN